MSLETGLSLAAILALIVLSAFFNGSETALTAVSARPPLGRLGDQAYRVGPRGGSWDDRAELIWGIDFALEAIAARHRAGRAAEAPPRPRPARTR